MAVRNTPYDATAEIVEPPEPYCNKGECRNRADFVLHLVHGPRGIGYVKNPNSVYRKIHWEAGTDGKRRITGLELNKDFNHHVWVCRCSRCHTLEKVEKGKGGEGIDILRNVLKTHPEWQKGDEDSKDYGRRMLKEMAKHSLRELPYNKGEKVSA